MSPDAVLIPRIRFAFTIGYHILWPAWTIGISGFIVILNVLWLRTRRTRRTCPTFRRSRRT
jgi:cytochrome d ubiquinol oxidase subunit I